ncbi:hypothetical protein SELR_pSRC300320 (plasmid) [Selenomonas ruminantium subsp. lactilytica TAM6421]|uniref:Uncharacterized protein n=1 Tax=Selenomonas ruminantium subsp. lactilytica (strain NBRC 103574 / TAM6421) TaxID=927704 RepID=I0GWG8_SELRL|nr:hypothetical protein [Selenomonas ruminantium]BAL85105.1 hypothetical protein SELR_pSRC300320 [Selenomonas ruminantium subsp. lactilytica TAM6421]
MAAKKKTEAEVTGYEVAEAYKKCRSFLANSVEIPIKDGKVNVSTEFAEHLRKEGYIK